MQQLLRGRTHSYDACSTKVITQTDGQFTDPTSLHRNFKITIYMDILALAIHHMIPFSVPQTLQDMGLINVSNRSLTVGWVWTIKSGRIKIYFFGFYCHHISMYISCVKSVFCLGLPFYGIRMFLGLVIYKILIDQTFEMAKTLETPQRTNGMKHIALLAY